MPRSTAILGTGSYAPARVLTNAELSRTVDTTDEWIVTRSGIRERRIAAPTETVSDMATEAARRALADAGLDPSEIDLLVVATMTADVTMPAAACLIQHKLGLRTTSTCFDLNAACSGYLYALDTASAMLASGRYQKALVIGVEKMSSVVDWQDRTTCVLFGDGAGATVLGATDDPSRGVLGTKLGVHGGNADFLVIPAGGSTAPASAATVANRSHYLKMKGREVYKAAIRVMDEAARDILEQHGLKAHPDRTRDTPSGQFAHH